MRSLQRAGLVRGPRVFRLASDQLHPIAAPIFNEGEGDSLMRNDAYLAECWANMVASIMTGYTTAQGQESLRQEVLKCSQEEGRLRARAQLRQMRRKYAISPLHFHQIDSELRG